MARRKKYKKHKEGWFSDVDWSINPETIREIGSVIFFIIAFFLLLAMLNGAGKLGVYTINYLAYLFGVFGYLLFIIFALVGYFLWNPKKVELKASSWIGGLMLIIAFPALISPAGGAMGLSISGFFRNLIGPFATFVLLFGLSVIGFILLFNTSVKNLYLGFMGEENTEKQPASINSTKVSVFTTLKNTFKAKPATNKASVEVAQMPMPSKHFDANWQYPPLDILEISTTKATSGNIAKNVETLQKTLADFSIDVVMGDVNIGPTVTQYTFKPVEGVKLNQIIARQSDLALALAAHPIRIEAPIPGKAAVGIEIPNKISAVVTMREILETDDFKKAKSNLSIALGRDVAGLPVTIDLKKMPHMLIAGATGSGKSICINGIIMSFLYQNSPEDLRLILIDPKRVEFTAYNDIPHLLTPVIVEPDKTLNALKWAVAEMERRYKMLAECGKRDILSYNANPGEQGKLPYIVIVIDELADLMMKSAKEVEAAIVRLAQMARAVGMHLIIATQRPSVNVITGLIKANVSSRIAFAVASQIDSRTIIDQSGAEKLLGKGDMLYISPEFGKPKRIQGVLVTEKEIKGVADFLRKTGQPAYDNSIMDFGTRSAVNGEGGEIDDDMYEEAKEVVVSSGKASASYLQRRLRIGYARAARLLDILEEQGVVGPAEGAKPRQVLVGSDHASGEFPPDDPRLDEKR